MKRLLFLMAIFFVIFSTSCGQKKEVKVKLYRVVEVEADRVLVKHPIKDEDLHWIPRQADWEGVGPGMAVVTRDE